MDLKQIGLFLSISLLLVAAACGGDDGASSDQAAGNARVIRVVPSDLLKFEPAEIGVRVGERVSLTIDNRKGSTLHDFTVDAMPVHDVHAEGDHHAGAHVDQASLHVAVEGGKTGTIAFDVTAPGEYEFYCTVPNHAAAGMRGKIKVTG